MKPNKMIQDYRTAMIRSPRWWDCLGWSRIQKFYPPQNFGLHKESTRILTLVDMTKQLKPKNVVQPIRKFFELQLQRWDYTDKNSGLELPSYANMSNFIFVLFLLIL